MDSAFIVNLQGKEFVLYAGLLAEAHERGLQSIETELLQLPLEENGHVAVAKAIVTMKDGSRFVEFGDAGPKNVGAKIVNALPRMALTRAKGRALRDAVNVGMTMREELPDLEDAPRPESRGDRAAAMEAPAATGPTACSEDGCGTVLNAGQVAVSERKYGRRLCPTHQREATQ